MSGYRRLRRKHGYRLSRGARNYAWFMGVLRGMELADAPPRARGSHRGTWIVPIRVDGWREGSCMCHSQAVPAPVGEEGPALWE